MKADTCANVYGDGWHPEFSIRRARGQGASSTAADKLRQQIVSHLTEGSSSWRQVAHRLDGAAADPDGLFSHAALAAALEEVRPQEALRSRAPLGLDAAGAAAANLTVHLAAKMKIAPPWGRGR
jgi:hypothetical protein